MPRAIADATRITVANRIALKCNLTARCAKARSYAAHFDPHEARSQMMFDQAWATTKDGGFPPLDRVLASSAATDGVYIIWHGGGRPRTVCVGQGAPVSRCIEQLRMDPEILAHDAHGLFVTWAGVPAEHRNGVVRYLVATLRPLVTDQRPDAATVAVSLPWAA
jgi:hypothetical protein